jgi:hypothetical protein
VTGRISGHLFAVGLAKIKSSRTAVQATTHRTDWITMKDSFWDRIALRLWRDRDDYDLAISTQGAKHNISAWTRWKPGRQRLIGALLNGQLWLGVAFAVTAAVIPMYLQRLSETDKKVQAHTGKLQLECVQEPDGVLTCRQIGKRDNHVIPFTDSNRADDNGALNK